MIEVKNLVKKYGNHTAVDNLNFTVESGKIYGFLGPNGAGKSTTMNIMTGYIGATEGDVIIDGHSISEEPGEAKKHIGYLPEIPPLYTDMKVLEYLKFAAELKGIEKGKRAKAITDAMNLTKLTDVSHRLIKNLSKGYKQRVGLAQAVLGMPEIIILDEPTVGLDPKQIIEIRDMIKKLGKKHTVILSSHILQEVSAVCDEVMIISHGQMVACDTPDNLEKIMEDTSKITIKVKASKKDIDSALKDIMGIDKIEYKNSSEQDVVEVIVTTDVSVDIREKLFYAFAENNLPVIEMYSYKMSLEDVFLKLTSGNKKVVNKVKRAGKSKKEDKSIKKEKNEEMEDEE
ncbi:MAG: ABC transporter ATP-binding protein [Lachnospiraceae bacterium]|nr:ABC transporter ATP-binding protein [Lachnospiraceae bacterium]MDE6233093.1 ABC transporter ATP-binding protein [Lachnospiraceae bacterium]MDE6253474.1 ABC transporter ATP-binding protein [Lachnospiraceae bacterium]